jgi:hypothetical protein
MTGHADKGDRNLSKMLTYMDAFSRFRTLNTLSQLETLLGSFPQLEMFEKAQLSMTSHAYILISIHAKLMTSNTLPRRSRRSQSTHSISRQQALR